MNKTDLRQKYMTIREQLPAEDSAIQSSNICKFIEILTCWKNAQVVMLYYPIRNEVDVMPLFDAAAGQGKKIVLPRVNPDTDALETYYVEEQTDLITGAYGITEPDPARCKRAAIQDIDIVIVPGVAFDTFNNRIGYGRGYYDRFLKRLDWHTNSVMPAYDCQMINRIPVEKNDVKPEIIVSTGMTYYYPRKLKGHMV